MSDSEGAELVLSPSGWEIHGGDFNHCEITVAMACQLAPEDREWILLKTRRHCANLRDLAVSRGCSLRTATRLLDLRDELRKQLEQL